MGLLSISGPAAAATGASTGWAVARPGRVRGALTCGVCRRGRRRRSIAIAARVRLPRGRLRQPTSTPSKSMFKTAGGWRRQLKDRSRVLIDVAPGPHRCCHCVASRRLVLSQSNRRAQSLSPRRACWREVERSGISRRQNRHNTRYWFSGSRATLHHSLSLSWQGARE